MAKKDTSCCNEKFKTTIGGQALIEGIMMRGPKKDAIVVNGKDGMVVEVSGEDVIYPDNLPEGYITITPDLIREGLELPDDQLPRTTIHRGGISKKIESSTEAGNSVSGDSAAGDSVSGDEKESSASDDFVCTSYEEPGPD